jgi:hypothetical protein
MMTNAAAAAGQTPVRSQEALERDGRTVLLSTCFAEETKSRGLTAEYHYSAGR